MPPDPSHIRPSPLQRDVGDSTMLDGGVREGCTRGGTQSMGGPLSTSRNRTTTLIVVRFRYSFLSSLPLTTYAQRRRFAQH